MKGLTRVLLSTLLHRALALTLAQPVLRLAHVLLVLGLLDGHSPQDGVDVLVVIDEVIGHP